MATPSTPQGKMDERMMDTPATTASYETDVGTPFCVDMT